MLIFVKAKPAAFENKVEKVDDTHFVVSVKAPPLKGFANRAIQYLLAEYFNIPKSKVYLKSGYSSMQKMFEIVL